jgi:hypothetical protein
VNQLGKKTMPISSCAIKIFFSVVSLVCMGRSMALITAAALQCPKNSNAVITKGFPHMLLLSPQIRLRGGLTQQNSICTAGDEAGVSQTSDINFLEDGSTTDTETLRCEMENILPPWLPDSSGQYPVSRKGPDAIVDRRVSEP